MKHIYLSPHLDDAVLSCGGAIHRQTSAGEAVLVLTLFAEDAAPGVDLSAFALEQHRHWGSVPQPMVLRRTEDIAALTLLSAEALHLDYHDAVYRASPGGDWLYPDLRALFGEVHPADPLDPAAIADRLAGMIPADEEQVLYAPLGVGRHADHQITHAAARQLLERGLLPGIQQVAFYEDYPYAEGVGAVEAALSAADADGWRLEVIRLDPADVAAKASALGYYQSQMAVLFGGVAAMPNRVWTFAASRSSRACLAERLWRPE